MLVFSLKYFNYFKHSATFPFCLTLPPEEEEVDKMMEQKMKEEQERRKKKEMEERMSLEETKEQVCVIP